MVEEPNQEPQTTPEVPSEDRDFYVPRNYWRTAGIIVAAIVILIALVFGARAIYHATHKVKVQPASTKQLPQAPSANLQSGSSAGQASGGNSGSQNTSAGGSSVSNGTSGGGKIAANQLPNSGPGDVIAWFAGSSALGALGHRFYIRRRND